VKRTRLFPKKSFAEIKALHRMEQSSPMFSGGRTSGIQNARILWVESAILDAQLHQASLFEILSHLAKHGHHVTFLATCPRRRKISDRRVEFLSILLRYAPIISTGMFAIILFFFLPFYVARESIDFIVTRPDVPIFAFFPSLIVSKAKKTKLVLDIRSTPVEVRGFQSHLQKISFSASVIVAKEFFDGITVITHPMKMEICKTFSIDPSSVGVWTSGVSLSLFSPEKTVPDSEGLKRLLGFSNKFVVFYHGAMSPTRGLTETVEAMKVLAVKYPNVVLFVLGTGTHLPALKALVETEGLRDQVVFHEPVKYESVPKFIGMADVCIVPLPDHPYWRFQCPLKLMEYLAMGKVVVVTDITAHRSVIGEAKCGIYVSSNEPSEIARSIAYAYDNRSSLEEWGKSGRTIVREKYTWDEVAKDLETYLLLIQHRIRVEARL